MFIKKIIIHNFKSFGPNTAIYSLDRKLNLFIGENNSGKTNILSAIEFALNITNTFSDLTAVELKTLIHKDAVNKNEAAAYVELVFDNSDKLIPIDDPEVSLCRIIANDELKYQLNGKIMERVELKNILEMLGFSKSYPFYFIIRQEDINRQAVANDVERLKILKKISGIEDFLNTKEKTLRIIKETTEELDTVSDFLSKIDVQLALLETNVNTSEHKKIFEKIKLLKLLIEKRKISENEELVKENVRKQETVGIEKKQWGLQIQVIDEQLKRKRISAKGLANKLIHLKSELSGISLRKQQLEQQKLKRRIILETLQDQVALDQNHLDVANSEKDFVDEVIRNKVDHQNALEREYHECLELEKNYSCDLQLAKSAYNAIFEKGSTAIGFETVFFTEKDRNFWIENQLVSVKQRITFETTEMQKLTAELAQEDGREGQLEGSLQDLELSFNSSNGDLSDDEKNLREIQIKQRDIGRERQQTLLDLGAIEAQIGEAQKQHIEFVRAVQSVIGGETFNGILSVKKVLKANPDLNQHFHGLMVDIFQCDHDLEKVIEVIAKNRIFYHVVDADDIATKILREMNELNLPGSPIFLPINRIAKNGSASVSGVLQKLVYNPSFEDVMSFIFGGVLICRDLEHAVESARSKNGVKCVTLSGDLVSEDGALSGGYIPIQTLRMAVFKNWKKSGEKIQELRAKLRELESRSTDFEKQLVTLNDQSRELQKKLEQFGAQVKKSKTNASSMKRRLKLIRNRKVAKNERMENIEKNLLKLRIEREKLEQALSAPFLSPEDQKEADDLNANIIELSFKHTNTKKRMTDISAQSAQLAEFMQTNLLPRQAQIASMLSTYQNNIDDLKALNGEIDLLTQDIHGFNDILIAKEQEINEIQDRSRMENADISELNSGKRDLKFKIEDGTKKLIQLMGEKKNMEILINDLRAGIATAENAVQNDPAYDEMPKDQLITVLENAKFQFDGYQGESFTSSKEILNKSSIEKRKLEGRRGELLEHGSEIRELAKTLDNQVEHAIKSTYRQLQIHFKDIFNVFAPQGHGRLELNLIPDDDSGNDTLEEFRKIEKFAGLKVHASFSADAKDEQITDKQKLIVALVFILAIQKCAKSPFYLIDFVEKEFSEDNRKKIADILKNMSAESQVIGMVLEPEMLSVATTFYLVEMDEVNCSQVKKIPIEAAEELVYQRKTSSI